MKAVILAGGIGTRISEETTVRPKPMIEIGGRPVLWHIMKMYSAHGINDFIVCLGYKGFVIKEYFANYGLHMSDVTFDMTRNSMKVHRNDADDWRVSLIDTGDATMTGGRLKRVMSHVDADEFCMTYGDGVSDVDISATLKFHREHGGLATVTAVHPPKRFGQLEIVGTVVKDFKEKPDGEGGYINGGFFVLSSAVYCRCSGRTEANMLLLTSYGQLCLCSWLSWAFPERRSLMQFLTLPRKPVQLFARSALHNMIDGYSAR
jgi:glucose-1-phosphate cytidylyltransferase